MKKDGNFRSLNTYDFVKKEYPIDFLPDGHYTFFSKNFVKNSISAGKSLLLFQFIAKEDDINSIKRKNQIREVLKDLTITIYYSDIYGKTQPIESRNLNWFGRY